MSASETRESVRQGKSRYRKKLQRKFGRGGISSRWMWWMERGERLAIGMGGKQ